MRCTGKICLRFATAIFPVNLGVRVNHTERKGTSMSFFGSIMKGIGNAAQDTIKRGLSENWRKINSMSQNRLEEIYREREESGQRDTTYTLIVLALTAKNPYTIKSTNEDLSRKIKSIKRTIELEDSRDFREIREAIKSFENRFES